MVETVLIVIIITEGLFAEVLLEQTLTSCLLIRHRCPHGLKATKVWSKATELPQSFWVKCSQFCDNLVLKLPPADSGAFAEATCFEQEIQKARREAEIDKIDKRVIPLEACHHSDFFQVH